MTGRVKSSQAEYLPKLDLDSLIPVDGIGAFAALLHAGDGPREVGDGDDEETVGDEVSFCSTFLSFAVFREEERKGSTDADIPLLEGMRNAKETFVDVWTRRTRKRCK